MRTTAFVLAAALIAFPTGAPAEPATAQPIDYTNPSNWLCLPGRNDACAVELTSSVVQPDGSSVKRTYASDPSAPVDCFYVYPTVSRETTANADMTAAASEQHVARDQFARFGAKCRLFAPLYRQMTVAGMRGTANGLDWEMPYQDVLAAWKTYLARDNHGRGVVLIGHSQGSSILVRLIASQLDGTPLQSRLISAIVPGTDVEVPVGRDVGGTFQHVPLCRTAAQTGCVIAYSTFLATMPPGEDAHFGESSTAGDVDACVNPAALDGTAQLDDELPALGAAALRYGTTFIETPRALAGACATHAGHAYLAISVDERAATLDAALTALESRQPQWGLHAFDVNLVLGNLIDLVGKESITWLGTRPGRP